jgi:hypothetical protein
MNCIRHGLQRDFWYYWDSDLEFMVLFRSSSIITALTSTSKQADLYLGYRLKLK